MRLALGTVQFGLAYGISNRHGQISSDEAGKILACASERAIDLLDTASAYGTSEAIIGEHLARSRHGFLLITKTPPFGGRGIGSREIQALHDAFERSLARLHEPTVYGLLVHDARDLLHEGADDLFDALMAIKQCGKALKIGVSVYDPADALRILQRFPVEIVQAPFNVFDQRLLEDDILHRLATLGVEAHVRSIFLQGLLLMRPDDLPMHVAPLRERLREFHEAAMRASLTPMEAALMFIRGFNDIERVIVGVTTARELVDLEKAFSHPYERQIQFEAFAAPDLAQIDPRSWPA